MVLCCGDPNLRHRGEQSIVLHSTSNAALERVHMHATGLLHNLTDPALALLEGPQCLVLRLELLSAAVVTTAAEVNLAHCQAAQRVLYRVNSLKHLQVGDLLVPLLLSNR